MPRNASGTYTLPAGNPVVTGTLIESTWANDTLGDLASAMTDSLSRDGEGGMTAALRVVDGTVSAPGLAFVNETGSGLYRTSAGDYSFAVLGSQKIRCRSTGVDVTGMFGVTGNVSVTGETLTVASTTAYHPQIIARNKTNDANAGYLVLEKDRAGAVVQNGDVLGSVIFRGYDGAAYLQGAAITASVNAAPGTNDMPTAMIFATTPDGGSGVAERMRLQLGLSVGTTAEPGAGAIFATGNITAYYSDERLKTKLGNLESALDKICAIETFYYEANETAQALGYKAEREVGVSAQSVQAVFPELVAPAPIDEQYLTVRYERLVAPIIEAIKELRAEVNALKGE
jgi:hypothetical protein